jgi:magnesium transporter
MEYPQDTAGALMDPRVGAFSATLTIVEAIERLRGMRQRGLRELFAVDEQMQLIGQIEVEDLVLASRDRTIRDIVHRVSATVRDTDKITHVAQTLQQYPQSVLPVLNETGRFLGVIRNSQLSERQAGRGRSRWFRWG